MHEPLAMRDMRASRSATAVEMHEMHVDDRSLARLAAGQRGVVTRAQLTAAGLSRSGIAHRVARGRLHPVFRGVFLVGHPVPPPLARETAALLTAGPDAALSHRTAAQLHGLLPNPGPTIHVLLIARRSPRPQSGLHVHTTAALNPAKDLRRVQGLRVTAPLRTLLDLATAATPTELSRAVQEAQIQRLTTHSSLVDAVRDARGRRGATALRDAIGARAPTLTRSDAEDRFLSLVAKAQLPAPQTNVRVNPYELDALWRDQGLTVEIDGFAFHSTRAAFERDRARDAELQARGLRVMRVTWRQLVDEPEAVVARLARALAVAASPTLSPSVRTRMEP